MGSFLGRPRGLRVDSKSKRRAVDSTHVSSPQGLHASCISVTAQLELKIMHKLTNSVATLVITAVIFASATNCRDDGSAVEHLSSQNPKENRELLDRAHRDLKSEDKRIRYKALDRLAPIVATDFEAVTILLNVLRNDENPEVRGAAARVLANLAESEMKSTFAETVKALVKALDDKATYKGGTSSPGWPSSVRNDAAYALCLWQTRGACRFQIGRTGGRRKRQRLSCPPDIG